jgi:hypothetical protein
MKKEKRAALQDLEVTEDTPFCQCVKNFWSSACTTGLLLACACPAVGAGQTAFTFMEVGEGAKPAGLGQAYTARADDAFALYWNPAGLGKLLHPEMATSYTDYLMDVKAGTIDFVTPLSTGGFGLGATYFNYGRISGDTGAASGSGVADDYTPYSLSATLAYGARMAKGLYAGISLKGMSETIMGYSAQGVAADAGLLYEYKALLPMAVGLTVRNAGFQTKAFITETNPLPLRYTLGLAVRLLGESLILSSDMFYQPDLQSLAYNFGAEYAWNRMLFLRTGYQTTGTDLRAGNAGDSLTGVCLGVGMLVAGYRLDYAYVPFNQLGAVHLLSLSLAW